MADEALSELDVGWAPVFMLTGRVAGSGVVIVATCRTEGVDGGVAGENTSGVLTAPSSSEFITASSDYKRTDSSGNHLWKSE